jgi:hypothetical protein
MPNRPSLTIVHEISGRVRLLASLDIRNPKKMTKSVKDHPGIFDISYSPITKSILVLFNPKEVSREELVIRIGLYISIENNDIPIKVLSQPQASEMSDSAYYAGLSLLIAITLRVLRNDTKNIAIMDWLSGALTSYSVLDHGWSEIKKSGYFHPEVLSIVYLLVSMIKGTIISAAIITWFSTFGRHLLHEPPSAVELKPIQVTDKETNKTFHEVNISSMKADVDKVTALGIIPAIIKYAVTGDASSMQGNLIEGIRDVSSQHGDVLEGLGELSNGMPIRIQQ